MDLIVAKQLRQLVASYGAEKAEQLLLRQLIQERGVAETAKALHKHYYTIRDRALALGIPVVRGRRPDRTIKARNDHIRKLRSKKYYLKEIGEEHGIGRERVRQILEETGGDPLKR